MLLGVSKRLYGMPLPLVYVAGLGREYYSSSCLTLGAWMVVVYRDSDDRHA